MVDINLTVEASTIWVLFCFVAFFHYAVLLSQEQRKTKAVNLRNPSVSVRLCLTPDKLHYIINKSKK